MIYKLLGTIIILAAGLLAFITLKGDLISNTLGKPCVQLTPAQQFTKLINDDFEQLAKSKQLPVEWSSISTVEFQFNSVLAKALLGNERPNFQRIKEGENFLELNFLDIPDEENPGVIIQASLFNIKSKNKIFEVGRTYSMSQLNNKADAK